MSSHSRVRTAIGIAAAGVGLAAGTYAAYATVRWFRYGHVSMRSDNGHDTLLDRFMPAYEVVERHYVFVAAPAAVTLAAAREQDFLQVPLIRAVFRARELILRARADTRPQPRGLLAMTQALGWGMLAEVPDHEVVV